MAGPLYEKRFAKHSFQFVPSSEGYIPSSIWPESDNIPTDFQFLADTELNFDPQYESPIPDCLFGMSSRAPREILGLSQFKEMFRSSTTYTGSSIADLRTVLELSSMITCTQVRDLEHLIQTYS